MKLEALSNNNRIGFKHCGYQALLVLVEALSAWMRKWLLTN